MFSSRNCSQKTIFWQFECLPHFLFRSVMWGSVHRENDLTVLRTQKKRLLSGRILHLFERMQKWDRYKPIRGLSARMWFRQSSRVRKIPKCSERNRVRRKSTLLSLCYCGNYPMSHACCASKFTIGVSRRASYFTTLSTELKAYSIPWKFQGSFSFFVASPIHEEIWYQSAFSLHDKVG